MRYFWLPAAALLFAAGTLSAAPCVSGTLASYIGLGSAGCTVGATVFDSFNTLPAITGATAIAPGSVNVTPVSSASTAGLSFSTSAASSAGQLRESLFGYRASGSIFSGESIALSGASASGSGAVTLIQNYCLGGSFSSGVSGCSGVSGTLLVLSSGSDSTSFASPMLLSVVNDFTVDAGRTGSASGGTFTNLYTVANAPAIPEPASSGLCGAALAAFALLLRRRRFSRRGAQSHR